MTEYCPIFCIFAANLHNKNYKSIKALKYIFICILALLLLCYLLPAILLNVPSIQQDITNLAEKELRDRLGTDVNIGSVEFELFSKIVLKNLYIPDQAGDTLFNAQRLSAGFDIWPLLHGKLVFSSAQLFSFQLNLWKERNETPLNLQFVIDAFASKDTLKESKIDLHIHTLNIRRGNFCYHVNSEEETPGILNEKHLDISNITAKIQIAKLTDDTISATINKLSMKERSGLEIKRLLFSMTGSKEQLNIHPFELRLPNSHLQIDSLHATFPQNGALSNLLLQTAISLNISDAEITPRDIKALVPALGDFREKITLKGRIHGNFNELYLSGQANSTNMSLTSNVSVTNLSVPDSTYIDGEINHFHITSQGILKIANDLAVLPDNISYMIKQLGQVEFHGNISGYFRDLMASGLLSTGYGELNVNLATGKDKHDDVFLRGHIQTPEFNVSKLFQEENPYGNIVFDIQIDAKQDLHKKLAGTVNATIDQFTFSDHIYKNIHFKGDFTHSSFNGEVDIDDSYGKLFAEGLFKINGDVSEFDFRAKANHIQLDKLNLSKIYPDSELSFTIDANFTGNTLENTEGSIAVRKFFFQTQNDNLSLDSIFIYASGMGEHRKIAIQSDIVKMELLGAYSYNQLIPAVKQTMHQYLPAIISSPKKPIVDENNFYLDVTIENTEKLSKALHLPITVLSSSKVYGQYNHTRGFFELHASLPSFNWENMRMEETTLTLNNSQQMVNLDLKGIRYGKFDVKTDFGMQLTLEDNELKSSIRWKNREESLYQGQLSALVRFIAAEKQSPGKIDIDLLPAQVTFNNSTWTIHPANLSIEGNKIAINHLNVEHADQFVKIDGVISKDTADYLYVDLNKINLDYIFNALVIPSLNFGGIATGKAVLNDLHHTQKLTTNLNIKDFSFNDAVMGDLKLDGSWDNIKQGILMTGNAYTNDTTQLAVNGMIYPAKKELSILFGARNANAAFLRKYLDNVTSEFSGKINGNIRLYGSFKNINIEGNALVRDAKFGIDFLNTVYSFSDSVYCNEGRIALKNTTLYDTYGNRAVANGVVKHQSFRDFTYSATIQANHFQIFNATEKLNPTLFGTTFGTGNIKISGDDDNVNIDVNVQTNEHTKMSLNFNERANIEEYNFITFISKNEMKPKDQTNLGLSNNPQNASSSQTNIKLNMMLNVTPDAMLELYMDPVSGDKIRSWGKGNMQIQYGTKIPPRIYGNYSLERGTYNFSLQQVIYKDFRIREGSAISFQGDPNTAILNIDALYSVSANLGDLDHSFNVEQKTPMSSVMVDCLLNIKGDMQHPSVKFDLELPSSSDELERQVKSIISTEELMNRQIIFLLALGRFYTEENISGKTNNDFANVASSTLSTQLTGLLGPLSENFQIGTNIRTNNYEEYTDTEVKVLLSSQLLNNRLLINGNLGYKDNPADQTSFVGDFDLEYKLTKTGNIRLKAYNHYNDKYYYVKSALTTQGVGILFRRDFDDMYDFFKTKKKVNSDVSKDDEDYYEAEEL